MFKTSDQNTFAKGSKVEPADILTASLANEIATSKDPLAATLNIQDQLLKAAPIQEVSLAIQEEAKKIIDSIEKIYALKEAVIEDYSYEIDLNKNPVVNKAVNKLSLLMKGESVISIREIGLRTMSKNSN